MTAPAMRGTGVIGRPASKSFVESLRIDVSSGELYQNWIRKLWSLVSERTCEPRMYGGDTDVVRRDDGVQGAHEAQYTVL
jgi:hypothetical protein